MKVGKVLLGSDRPVERLHVRDQLNEIAGNEPRSEPHMAHQLHQQGGGIPARSRALRQGFLGQLHTGFEANQIANVLGDALIDADHEIDGAAAFAGNPSQIALDQRRCRRLDQVRH